MPLFGTEIQCPRCLGRVRVPANVEKVLICKECKFAIPFAYVRDFKQTPSVFVQLFGLPAAGKTTFLDMLRLHLYDLDRAWGAAGFYAQPITQLDMDHRAILMNERAQGIMPGSTPKRDRNQNEVYIMSLVHMVRWGSRFLVLMDHSGEFFGRLIIDVEEIPFLQHTPVTILLLSLPDLLREGKTVDALATSYITSLELSGVDFAKERRQLIVVFSKADLITNLPPELRDYLGRDTTYLSLKNQRRNFKISEAEIDNYILQMSTMSDVIRKWVGTQIRGGAAMLNMLDDKGIVTRFTVMSATGHPLSGGGKALEPTPRRVLDPFFWVLEYYKHLGSQDVVRANLNTILATFSPALRTAGSLVLLVALFLCAFGGSLYVFHLSQGSSEFVGFCLALLLLFVCTVVNQRASKPTPIARSVLDTTRLALFLSCVALQTLPAVQQVFSQLMLYQFLSIFILGTAVFSCFQPAARLAAQSRVTLAAIVGSGALLLYNYRIQTGLQSLPFLSPDAYTVLNNILIWTLVAGAVLVLLLSAEKRTWLDWTILFVAAPIYGIFQFVYGPQELFQVFSYRNAPFLSPDNVVFVDRILVVIVAIVLPISLFFLYRFARLSRLPLLVLALVSSGMLNFLGSGVELPILPVTLPALTSPVGDLLSPDRIVVYGLVAATLLVGIRILFARFPANFAFWDYVVLFLAAVVCAQLQTFPWGSPAPLGNMPAFLAALFVVNRIVASCLTLLVFIGSVIALATLLLPLARRFKQVEQIVEAVSKHAAWLSHLPLWLERVMAFGTAAGCALLAGLYGQVGPFSLQIFAGGGVSITVSQIVALLYAILALIALGRLMRPFTRGDRFLLLMNIVFCTAFYFVRAAPPIPLSFVLPGWDEGAYYSEVPNLLFACLLICIALISFWWSARCKFSGDRRLLQVLFSFALTGGLLQLVAPSLFFTLLALLALLMGVVVASIATSST